MYGRDTIIQFILMYHGRTNEGCLGNASGPIVMYVSEGDIKALAMYLIGYLESVNLEDSAGVWLGSCKEIAIDDDGNPLHDEAGNYIFIANEFSGLEENCRYVTRNYSQRVDLSKGEYLTSDAHSCDCCNEPHNAEYFHEVRGALLCDNCFENTLICDCCGNICKKDTAIVKDNIIICKKCAVRYLPKCVLCGEYIMPDNIDKDNLKKQLILLRRDYDFKKKYHIIYNVDNVNIILTSICDSCKEEIKGTPVENKIIMFTKQKVDKDYVTVLKENIPVNSIYKRCNCCGSQYLIENMVPYVDGNMYCSSCLHNKYMNGNTIDDTISESIINDYIKVTMFNKKDGISIKRFPKSDFFISRSASLYNKKLLNNLDKWDTEIDNQLDLIYNKEEHTLVLPEIKDKVCERCHAVISEGENYCKTKEGNILCMDCASNTYTRCSSCGKVVPVTRLTVNVGYDTQNTSECVSCYINNNANIIPAELF